MEKIRFTPEAERRLRKIPFFIRPFVRQRAIAAAEARGLQLVDEALLDELKRAEHRGR